MNEEYKNAVINLRNMVDALAKILEHIKAKELTIPSSSLKKYLNAYRTIQESKKILTEDITKERNLIKQMRKKPTESEDELKLKEWHNEQMHHINIQLDFITRSLDA